MSTATPLEVLWLILSLVSVGAAGNTLGRTYHLLRDLRADPTYVPGGPRDLYLRWARTRAAVLGGAQAGSLLLAIWACNTPNPARANVTLYNTAINLFLIALLGGLTYITVREPLVHAQIERVLAAAWLAAPHTRRSDDPPEETP